MALAAMLKISNGHVSAMVHWIHFMFGSTVGLIIYAACTDRAFIFYTDIGTEKHNKILHRMSPKWAWSGSGERNFNSTSRSYFWNR